MIIKTVFHTYKEEFPLLNQLQGMVGLSHDVDLKSLFGALILEIGKYSGLTKYCYITRHTGDKIPEDTLKHFKKKYPRFVESRGPGAEYGLPTVWFVVFVENHESLELIRRALSNKHIQFFEDASTEYESIDEMPTHAYAPSFNEAKMFPHFLHRVNQISLDLLRKGLTDELKRLKELEWMQGSDLDQKIKQLKNHLSANSEYYQENISGSEPEESMFWKNFRIVHVANGTRYSWPHFLFNICGE